MPCGFDHCGWIQQVHTRRMESVRLHSIRRHGRVHNPLNVLEDSHGCERHAFGVRFGHEDLLVIGILTTGIEQFFVVFERLNGEAGRTERQGSYWLLRERNWSCWSAVTRDPADNSSLFLAYANRRLIRTS